MKHTELTAIPAIETATDPILSEADLRQRWRALMGPLGFGERLLRFVLVGPDRRLLKMLSDVEIAAAPDPAFVAELMAALSDFLTSFEPGTTVAFCLTRPGIGGVSTIDRRWASLITDCATDFEVPVEPFFRANDEALVLVAA
ncbi:hypothetical protein MJO55_12640 [Mycolicibacterium rufum]|uniref:Uncharacterized protein n=1 Tax=Mycolicibacterium rufum TaxID=318424 RepID=A0A9X2Y4J4_9MYCO|nr:hypothetical protein [Mycolicibacterium rufum]KGI68152.1 hypothetical protein EU78_12705 [Mycolicibacterium rufum]MCV7073831.1 hypothetical protein [Mycolicibacterium rufum]ULP39177.1 hypothetical protein MJO55_12640 [Mycolicibacterium rufum]